MRIMLRYVYSKLNELPYRSSWYGPSWKWYYPCSLFRKNHACKACRLCCNGYVKEITYGVTLNNLEEDYLNGKKYYKYILKFPLLHNYEEWPDEIYIKSLNKKGAIDLSKINSDIIKFKGYRYFNNIGNKTTTLEVNLESYPKETSKLYIYVEAGLNSSPNSKKEIGKIEVPGTGVFTLTFSYQDLKFEDRECYYLSFTKKD